MVLIFTYCLSNGNIFVLCFCNRTKIGRIMLSNVLQRSIIARSLDCAKRLKVGFGLQIMNLLLETPATVYYNSSIPDSLNK